MQIGANEPHALLCITVALGYVSGKMKVEWDWLPCRRAKSAEGVDGEWDECNVLVQSIELLQILLLAQIGRPY